MATISSRSLTSFDSLMDVGYRYVLRPAFVGDSFTVQQDLRQADYAEWRDSVEGGVKENLYTSIEGSEECYSVVGAEDGIAHVIFGVVDIPEPTVWLLGTNQGQRDASWILHELREFYTEFFKRWPETVCYSAPYNTTHHRWLQWMGFKFIQEGPRGDFNMNFFEFRRR